jgi:hypothetical protein
MSLHKLNQRSQEGYLMIDHRQSPGVSDEAMVQLGLPPGSGRGLFETATYTCSHCQAVVFMHPNRQRERAYCCHCEHRLCDACGARAEAGAKCQPLRYMINEILEQAERQAESGPTILLP